MSPTNFFLFKSVIFLKVLYYGVYIMFEPLSLEQFQKDIDDGWREYCDDKIHHWHKLQLSTVSAGGKDYCDKNIKHFRCMRRMR